MEKQENKSIKELSKDELVDLDLRGQIHGARLNLTNLQSLLKAKAKGDMEMLWMTSGSSKLARFNVFDQFFGEVDLLEGKFYLVITFKTLF